MINHCALIVLSGIALINTTVSAMDIIPSAGLTMQYTDNVWKLPDNEKHDLIIITDIGASIDTASGPFQLDANTSLKHTDYTRDSFSSQQYFNLSATAGWEMIKDFLDWQLQDFYTQQSLDSLNPNTPDNTQDTNTITFGPNLHYRISGRQSITLNPQYRKFSYEIQNIDNQQNSLDASWNYQLFRTVNVGLRGGKNKVDYDEQTHIDNTFTNIHLTLSSTRSDYNYSADIGSTRVDRESGSSVRGTTGNIKWSYDITGRSNLRAHFASELTDASTNLLNSSINPDDASFSTEQLSAEVMRNSIFKLTLKKNDITSSTNVWLELRKQDYEFALLNQEIQALGFEMNYPLTAILSTGIDADYSQTESTDFGRKDRQRSIGCNFNYRFSSKLLGTADFKYHETNSSIETMSFDEFTVFISLVYGYNGPLI
ncbi:MAG: hypothetical protein OEY06_03095 [Gammaproteobacteria bacterium]|nr:hypothetical protein [Gammaproteobacteria bacterium]